MKKYLKNTPTTAYVNYRLLSKGKVTSENKHAACFYDLFQYIPPGTDKIEFYETKDLVPYEDEIIKRWVDELRELGFPSEVKVDAKSCVFTVSVDDYKWKPHLLSALVLLRLIKESNLCKLPELYFQGLDEKPEQDRFKLLKRVHIGAEWCNSNHMATFKSDCDRNITHAQLFENFEASKLDIHYRGRGKFGYAMVNQAWWGGYVEAKEEPKPETKPEVPYHVKKAKKAMWEDEPPF